MPEFTRNFYPERFRVQVESHRSGTVRVDRWIKNAFPWISNKVWDRLFAQKAVLANGHPVPKGYKVKNGDALEIRFPGPLRGHPLPAPQLTCSILFEDSDLLIVEKPGGMPTQPLDPFETGTLVNALTARYPQLKEVGSRPLEPGLVHRLDQGTSGLLAVALTPESWTQLKKDLAGGKWKKIYLALVAGKLDRPLTLNHPLGHDPADQRKMKVLLTPTEPRRGRIYRAVTEIRPLRIFGKHTLVEIALLTGVTHQIRVHLSFRGHPVVGDVLYGGADPETFGLPAGRFFLHAGRLSLPHPRSGRMQTFTSPLPEDLQQVLTNLTD